MMFIVHHGKSGYDIINDIVMIPRDLLIKLLKKENELRHSGKYIAKYSQRDDLDWLVAVTEEIQLEAILSVCDKEIATKEGLEGLRSALNSYIDDPEVMSLALYVKYDRSHRGEIDVDGVIPDCKLVSLDGSSVSLFSCITSKPTVIVAGSYT